MKIDGDAMLAVQAALQGEKVFCKFLSANDTGVTGGHQAGIYISKPSIPILFDEPGQKGQNKEQWVKIKWQDDFETDSRFIYYGQGTRNEYRITNFGRGFPYLKPEYTGALFVLIKCDDKEYQGFVLNTEDEINQFLDAFGLSPTETNQLVEVHQAAPEVRERAAMETFIGTLIEDFPASEKMAEAARSMQNEIYNEYNFIFTNPDRKLIDWTNVEYRLFRALEEVRYGKLITRGVASVEDFIVTANKVLNRRKSRAGKSLEHHLAAIFDANKLIYKSQAVTEGNKKLDFLFPSEEAYGNPDFPIDRIISLAAKTTCKDRWRQVINEADRLRDKTKYLCTLQQGISGAQMDEMQAEQVVLVVPKQYILEFPKDRRNRIWTIAKFVSYIREINGHG